MAFSTSLFPGDEELGKRDDDHRPRSASSPSGLISSWLFWKGPMRYRRRRILPAVIGLVLLYFFFKHMPNDLGPAPIRPGMAVPMQRSSPTTAAQQEAAKPPPVGAPPRTGADLPAENTHYYNGQIRFYKLSSSLYEIARTMGHRDINRNILFAASNLKSAANLIPLACEMARWRRAHVNFIFMGRDDLPLTEILKVNGIGSECKVFWHDGRPDYSPWSSDYRMEMSVSAGLGHTHKFMHPQAVIFDNSGQEDSFFISGITEKAKALEITSIELPQDATENLKWITRLDSGSLKVWDNISVDILIHAPTDSSGSLIRLIKSLEQADYFGCPPPRLTIELPPKIDKPTQHFLHNLVWPPVQQSSQAQTSQVTLRHRIPHLTLTPEEASIRFVESFYPADQSRSHVLVLSPQAELSPLFYHYLKYTLLEYKYSSYGHSKNRALDSLLGISLELPSIQLNGSAPFQPPAFSDPRSSDGPPNQVDSEDQTPAFLWQAPNSNAALYFGDKWVEFHDFLGRLLKSAQVLNHPPLKKPKLFSEAYPSWTESLLELMHTRAYSMFYPSSTRDNALATIHNELFQMPEEFSHRTSDEKAKGATDPSSDLDGPLTADVPPPSLPSTEQSLTSQPLLSILPTDGDLPEFQNLPILAYNGQAISRPKLAALAAEYHESFRKTTGGCPQAEEKSGSSTSRATPMHLSAADLFCTDGDDEYDEGYNDDDEEEAEDELTASDAKGREKAKSGSHSPDEAERTSSDGDAAPSSGTALKGKADGQNDALAPGAFGAQMEPDVKPGTPPAMVDAPPRPL
ncbi:MAG: hypothetical protein M1819_005965 [Sarea resinae]|nr:MAG: hypothetical protein M1819_005965 [Sarea resinae]